MAARTTLARTGAAIAVDEGVGALTGPGDVPNQGVAGTIGLAGAAIAAYDLAKPVAEQLIADAIHGNSAQSPRQTEVYNFINRSTGEIDKIGITSDPSKRYSQAYLAAENVNYVTVEVYSKRYPAMVHENIALVHYRLTHGGKLPRLNKVTR